MTTPTGPRVEVPTSPVAVEPEPGFLGRLARLAHAIATVAALILAAVANLSEPSSTPPAVSARPLAYGSAFPASEYPRSPATVDGKPALVWYWGGDAFYDPAEQAK